MLGIALAFHPTLTHGVTIRDDQPDSGYLNLASQPEYSSVGLFVNDWGYTGSATLIAPDWILTAGHNLAAASSGTFTVNGTSYGSSQFIYHPNFQYGNWFAGYDVALVQLATPVLDVSPAALYTGSGEIGEVGTFVGYGFTGTGLTGYSVLDNLKRAFQNVIDGNFGNPSLVLGADFDNPHTTADNGFGSPVPLTLEGCVANGDSGGGVFITFGQQTYLAGVISFVANADGTPNADYGDASGFGRVSTLTPWILSVVPEPSSFTLLAGAGVALLMQQRFRRASGGRPDRR